MNLPFGIKDAIDFLKEVGVFLKKKNNWFRMLNAEKKANKIIYNIVTRFSDSLDTGGKTCSLFTILLSIQKNNYSEIMNEKLKRFYILHGWYGYFRSRIEANPIKTKAAVDEFKSILLKISELTEEIIKTIPQEQRLLLKNDRYGWPAYKALFDSTAADLSKLTKDADVRILDMPEWTATSLSEL